jgi:hypothetical protein
MVRITYQDLIVCYGNPTAFDLLRLVERLARIKNEIIYLDKEVRFQRALDALNEVNFAACA